MQIRLQLISLENDKLVLKNGRFSNVFGSEYRLEGAGLDVMSCDQQQIVLDRNVPEASPYQDHVTVKVSQQSPNPENDSYLEEQSETEIVRGHLRSTSRADVMQLHQEFNEFVKSRRNTIVSRRSLAGPIETRASLNGERPIFKMHNAKSERELLGQVSEPGRVPKKLRGK